MGEPPRLKIVVLGLSITSSWGNGHATTYRALARGLSELDHDVLFLERNQPWYEAHRDLPRPRYCRTELYESVDELKDRFAAKIRRADAVVIGSYVPDAIEIADWALEAAQGLRAFYDIDTPVTLDALRVGHCEYLSSAQIPRYDLYLSFAGGPTLARLEKEFGSPAARALYCSVDPENYYPEPAELKWDLGYLGTYSADRQPKLNELLLEPAKSCKQSNFVVAGSLYPDALDWPANVSRIEHLPPAEHRTFYNAQRFTLNLTRADMVKAGYSPSVRLFEAAACGVPIISDVWKGLDTILNIDSEILLARGRNDILKQIMKIPEERRVRMGQKARARVLRHHTYSTRARQLQGYLWNLMERRAREQIRVTLSPSMARSVKLAN